MSEDTVPLRIDIETELARTAAPATKRTRTGAISRNSTRRGNVHSFLTTRGTGKTDYDKILSDLPSYINWEKETDEV